MQYRSIRLLTAAALIGIACIAGGAGPGSAASSWPGLRGPSYDGSTADQRLLPDEGGSLAVSWKRDLGSGYSGAVVADGRVIALFADGDADVAAAFDDTTGEEIWRYRVSDTYNGHDGSHDGPISTPLVDDGRVFGLGPWGHLFALDAATGAEIWAVNVTDDLGGEKPFYGYSTSPVMVDGVLVVEIGAGEGKAIAGMDPDDGTVQWSIGDDKIQYHSPVVAELGGRQLILAIGAKTLFGIDAASGKAIFSHEHDGDERAMGGATIVPVPAGANRVFLMNKIDSSTMLEIKPGDGGEWSIAELWSNNAIKTSYVVPAYHDGYLYGMNNRIFTCVDAATGELKWRSRKPGDGFPTVVGDQIVVITKPGTLHVAEATSEAYIELASLELFGDHSWSTVAAVDGSLYARSMGELARIDATGSGTAMADAGTGSAGLASAGLASAGLAATASTSTDADSSTPAAAGDVPSDDPESAAGALGGQRDWVANTAFGAFLAEVEAADDKDQAIDAYLAAQSSFPIIEESGAVHFVWRGEDEDVGIVGDMIGFRREDPMQRIAGTDFYHYSTRLEPNAAVHYGFLPAFAEEAVPDPRNDTVADGVFGEVSWFAMPAWESPDFVAEAEASRQGRLETITWMSEAGMHEEEGEGEEPSGEEGDEAAEEKKPVERTAQVYLPSGYDENADRRYPVVYVHGGKNALEKGAMKNALDNLIGTSVRPMIAVFLYKQDEDSVAEFYNLEVYGKLMADELVPRIDTDYRTIAEPAARANVGVGSAGNASLLLTLAHGDLFGRVGIQAPTLSPGEIAEQLPSADERSMVMYIGWGTYHLRSPHEAWDLAVETRALQALLRERGHRPAGGETPDGMGWACWQAHTDELLTALFPG